MFETEVHAKLLYLLPDFIHGKHVEAWPLPLIVSKMNHPAVCNGLETGFSPKKIADAPFLSPKRPKWPKFEKKKKQPIPSPQKPGNWAEFGAIQFLPLEPARRKLGLEQFDHIYSYHRAYRFSRVWSGRFSRPQSLTWILPKFEATEVFFPKAYRLSF